MTSKHFFSFMILKLNKRQVTLLATALANAYDVLCDHDENTTSAELSALLALRRQLENALPKSDFACTSYIFDVWCTDGHNDENYFVRALSKADARKAVQLVSDLHVESVERLTDTSYVEDADRKKAEALKLNATYLYDSGT